MSSVSGCTNPACTCTPCGCGDDCRCGGVKLGDLERQVMEVLWRKPDTALTGREVADALPTYAYTTVSTVLNRLSHKGLVRRGDDAPRIRYSATDTDAAYTAVTMHRLLLAATDPAETLAQFAQIASPRQAAVLRNALTTPMDTP